MLRLAALALLLPLAGCGTATHIVNASDAASIATASASLIGRAADITLVSGERYRGTVLFMGLDSTAWDEPAGSFAVPTETVRSLLIDTRRAEVGRGTLVGAGLSFGLCFGFGALVGDAYGGDAGDNTRVGLVLGTLCAASGAVYGAIGGAAAGTRDVYILVDPVPTDAPD